MFSYTLSNSKMLTDRESIDKFLYENNLYKGIFKLQYSINEDMSIDLPKGYAFSAVNCMNYLPVTFNYCKGTFDCNNLGLKSLKGCPKKVTGNFFCTNNQLESLEGCPIINGYMTCDKYLKDSIEYKRYLLKRKLASV
jgi:hypothetical protein